MSFKSFLFRAFVFIALWNCLPSTDTAKYSKYGEGYGTDWIFFPDGDGTPHYVSLTGVGEEFIPQARSGSNDIEYRLYIRSNITDSIVLSDTAEPTLNVDLDSQLFKLPLKIVTHGWRSSAESSAVAEIKNAYLQLHKDVIVITVDWSYTASSIFYHWVANQTRTIGTDVSIFLDSLSRRYNVSGDQVHLIGHSLGAHVMGIAAKLTKLNIDRITGLDPARPLFEYPSRDESWKLDAKDARFVDIIHTCSGVLGIESNIGTVDFYPNSGTPPQPGCEALPKILEACSHGRSYSYFAESITNPKSFPSYQCNGWKQFMEKRCNRTIYMGEEVSRNITGRFYLKTNPKHPFGLLFT